MRPGSRLERALHEGAHQHVVALALKLRVACGRVTPGSNEEALLAEVLADAMEASGALGEGVAACIPRCSPSAGWRRHCRCWPRGRRCLSTCASSPAGATAAVNETTAYLFVAEAIANAARHAHATECTLLVADGGDALTVEVSRQRHRRGEAHAPAAVWKRQRPERRDRRAAEARLAPWWRHGTIRLQIPVDR